MNNIENNAAGLPVENTPTQTLFRFVSLRSPQLSDENEQDKRFVLAPEELKSSHFYKHILDNPGQPKQRLLREYAGIFQQSPDYVSEKDFFKENYTNLYELASWIAKNKETCTNDELLAKIDVHLAFTGDIMQLWNNLIYQVVAQKDFYIKETVMQMLLAKHILNNKGTEERNKILLGARIVLPKNLMLDENTVSGSQRLSKIADNEFRATLPNEEMKKQQLISEGKLKLGRYEKLTKNFILLEKQYRDDYQREYEIQHQKYQEEIAKAIEEYNAKVAENREKYCPTRTPGMPYDPKDPCQQIPGVPEPVLPKFNFQFRSEIEAEYLTRALKPENMDTLLDILGHDFQPESTDKERAEISRAPDLNQLLEGRNTFSEINSLITESGEKSNKMIAENTEANTEVYTSIGGVIVPMAKAAAVPFTFQLCPKGIYKLFGLTMALNVPDASWDVSDVYYELVSGSLPTQTGSNFVKSRNGNTIFLNDLLGQGVEFAMFEGASFDLRISFTNGRVAQFKTPGITIRGCISSKFELEVEETDNPVEPIKEEENFIPSGFGFKQIGIADYLKVEQSTHAYVEGEVAHIENIMAREYREKSTRKLRRSENTTTSSSDTEREQLSDTTTANRFEMQSEVSKVLQESNDFAGFVNASYGGKMFSVSAGANYANHRSKDESTRQAVTQAQDITARAMDRIVTKIHEERIEKIIDEFEENNSHGFDNRKGDKNVVGVYRWVDKLMKNQIYNYGKRMMFEFMVPEPAKLHLLGMTSQKAPDQIDLIKPEDPRTSVVMPMKNYDALTTDAVLKYWVSKYNVEVPEKPVENYSIGKPLSGQYTNENNSIQNVAVKDEIQIPENYIAVSCRVGYSAVGDSSESAMCILIGDIPFYMRGRWSQLEVRQRETFDKPYSKTVPISATFYEIFSGTANCVVDLKLTQDAKNAWYEKVFKAIIDAYEDALIEYNNKLAEEKSKAVEIKGSNPTFYRQIENTILRKNCISYMADRASGSTHGYGLEGLTSGSAFSNYETVLNGSLDKYTAFVKFMEQAFEWENLSYNLYPYYWGNKQNWLNLYQSEDTDPLFRAFMQSGMARVVVTVRPGFEETVQFYLATGKIWNGGEVPVIGDELYLSIADEMKEPKGPKQGKAWITRLPTALNILQAESIGLKVRHALPFSTENPDDFEVPSEVITEEKFNFEKDSSLLGGGTAEKWIELSFNHMDSYRSISDMDYEKIFPRIYECLGNTIKVDRDASWSGTEHSTIFYKALADEISSVEGVQAIPTGENGLTFRINISKFKTFTFRKPGGVDDFELLKISTDAETYVKIHNPTEYNTADRIRDKDGKALSQADFTSRAPLSKFLV
ncbi:hypothetical protein [Chryseobacterium herbae]|uniref:Uncharacterized protein n=1 Tax=Chryseobacterium herbae TaxID=2976476 RepID=A0ABT2IX23_9FLAO|nr:hypothetical protein [Chryseobacterium sp. pc1-10]MCT2563394.1 hypothetical protein [Chryseobacterium sp. pc1-10]